MLRLSNGKRAAAGVAIAALVVAGVTTLATAPASAAARDGFISQAKAGTMVLGWELTEKGRTAIQSGSSVTLVPFQAPQPNAATAAICNVEAR